MCWCGGALLVTLSVIYLVFKAHLTSIATSAFYNDTPYHLDLVEGGGLRWPGHLMQHSISLLGQIAHTQSGGVLGHCPVEKQMVVPLSANQI